MVVMLTMAAAEKVAPTTADVLGNFGEMLLVVGALGGLAAVGMGLVALLFKRTKPDYDIDAIHAYHAEQIKRVEQMEREAKAERARVEAEYKREVAGYHAQEAAA